MIWWTEERLPSCGCSVLEHWACRRHVTAALNLQKKQRRQEMASTARRKLGDGWWSQQRFLRKVATWKVWVYYQYVPSLLTGHLQLQLGPPHAAQVHAGSAALGLSVLISALPVTSPPCSRVMVLTATLLVYVPVPMVSDMSCSASQVRDPLFSTPHTQSPLPLPFRSGYYTLTWEYPKCSHSINNSHWNRQ